MDHRRDGSPAGRSLSPSLDENFNVVGESADDDGSNDQEESGND